MVAALSDGGAVHDVQVLFDHGVVIEFSVEQCVGVFLWIFAVDAIDARRLEDDIGIQFQSALGGGSVRGDKWATGACCQNDDALLLQMPDRTTSNKRLGNPIHSNRRHHACRAADHLQGILQSQSVDDGRQHAHVVSGCFLDLRPAGAFEMAAAKDVPAPYHHGDLATQIVGLHDLLGDHPYLVHVDPSFPRMRQAFATQLQDDSSVMRLGRGSFGF